MSYGPHIRPLGSDERAGVELPCTAPDCSEMIVATLDDETVEAAREAGQVVRVATSETTLDKWTCSPEHADAYRDAVREDHPDVDATHIIDVDE